jgi:hypothetical protein
MEWFRRIFLLPAFLTATIAALFADLSPKEVDEIREIRSFGLELVRLPNETV